MNLNRTIAGVVLLLFGVTMYATWWVYRAVPGAFVPNEDEGYFITIVQAPAGSSLEYTTEIMKKAENIYLNTPEILAVFSVAGFSFSGSAPNQGLMFARLKPFDERKDPAQSLESVLGRLFGQVFAIPGAMDAPVASLRFWGSMALALAVAGVAAYPVNRWMIARGKGHAAAHRLHHHH